jgi:septum site-determining protein MinC
MTKQQLIALVLDLQARQSTTTGPNDISSVTFAQGSPTEAPAPERTSLVISSSVRSGQTIEFPHGDVTVIGSVGSGAEIVAGGSIHVYGTLRGRAIAGTSGDRSARIFCQSLKAELLSIDGCYRVAENFDPRLRGTAVQARLDGLKMALEPLAGGENSGAGTSATGLQRRAADRFMSLISKSTMSRTQPTARFS